MGGLNLILSYLLFVFICWGCSQNSTNKKHFKIQENIVYVHDRIKEIHIPEENILINNYAQPYLFDNYMIIRDYKSYDKQVHLFDKKNYRYITSVADRGIGPNEITQIGHIEFNKDKRLLYITDHGKYKIFSYHIDSIIQNPKYKPSVLLDLKESGFPDNYLYINDTFSIAQVIIPIGDFDFKPSIARWNIKTGEINPMSYVHPDINKKRIVFAASKEYNLYAEGYCNRDLMTIADFDGNLICNVYGPNWDAESSLGRNYYGNIAFCKDKIITRYSGEKRFLKEGKVNRGTKLLVFDLKGNHLKTLETNFHIAKFCYDNTNNRIIMSLDDEIQFAYLDLDGLLD